MNFFKTIVQIFIQWLKDTRLELAMREAYKKGHREHRKVYVLQIGGRLRVVTKQQITALLKKHVFKKGVKAEDVEKAALYTYYPWEDNKPSKAK